LRGSSGSVTVTVFAETDLEDRPQYYCDALLNHSIQHRRHGVFIMLFLQ